MLAFFHWHRVKVIAFAVTVVTVVLFVFIIGRDVKTQTNYVCTDSDGGREYYVKGTAKDGLDPTPYTDMCASYNTIDGYRVIELSCGTNGRVTSEFYKCSNGCTDGACVAEQPVEETKPECVDSDEGRDYLVKGETTDFGDIREDNCFNSKTVTEFYCEQAAGQTRPSRGAEQKKCEYSCKDGACLEGPSEEELARIEKQKQIKEMIASISRINGMARGVNVMEKAFKLISKDIMATLTDFTQLIKRFKEIRPEIVKFQNKRAENLTDEQAEAFTNNMGELCQIGLTFEEKSGQLPQYLLLGAKMNRVAKDLKQAKIDTARAIKVAQRSKYSLTDKAEELNEAIRALQIMSDEAMVSTDFDEKNGKINEFYNQLQNVNEVIWLTNALQNIGQTTDTTQFKNFGAFSQFCSVN